MSTTTIMKNEAFAPILFEIERRILAAVQAAKTAGIEINDSHLRSTLNKVRKTSEGGSPKMPNESPRDQILAGLHRELLETRKCLFLEDEAGAQQILPAKLWTLCLRTIEESIQRYSTGPGSKGYQLFLESFIGKTHKVTLSSDHG
jgi:hypothetical protein